MVIFLNPDKTAVNQTNFQIANMLGRTLLRTCGRRVNLLRRTYTSERPFLTQYTENENTIIETTKSFNKEYLDWKVVSEMDEKAEMRPELLKQLFDSGLMGIEIPEKYGGSGLSFMNSIVAIEELAKYV